MSSTTSLPKDHGGSTSPGRNYQMSNKRVVTTPSWARTLPRDEIEYLYDYSAPSLAGISTLAPGGAGSARPGARTRRSLSSVVHEPDASTYGNAKPSSSSTIGKARDRGGNSSAHHSGGSDSLSTVINIPPRPSTSSNRDARDGNSRRNSRRDSADESTAPRSSSTSDSSAAALTPLAQAHSNSEVRRQGGAMTSAARKGPKATNNVVGSMTSSFGAAAVSAPPTGDRWWTFTLPSKTLDRVHEYVNRFEGDDRNEESLSTSDQGKDKSSGENEKGHRGSGAANNEKHSYARSMSMSMAAKLAPSNVFSLNHTQTPGWSTPWAPFHRDDESISANRDPFALVQAAQAQQSKTTRFENFILNNVFAPLFFRSINLVLAACTLGIASHIRIQEVRNNVVGIIGSSTMFVIIVSPFSIVHIFATVYIEYFGPPIGIWNVRTKMAHTLLELVFICLWSAILSIAFDDLFTSSLECTAFTPYARYNTPPASVGSASVDGTVADSICSQQIAQVIFIFLSVMLYMAVLIVSLLRIFVRVSRKV